MALTDDPIDRLCRQREVEERVLRLLDELNSDLADLRWTAIARTHIELGFMALNRAVIQPKRIDLPKG